MAHSEHDLSLGLETESNQMEISQEEIDLVWSVLQDVIRLADAYGSEDED